MFKERDPIVILLLEIEKPWYNAVMRDCTVHTVGRFSCRFENIASRASQSLTHRGEPNYNTTMGLQYYTNTYYGKPIFKTINYYHVAHRDVRLVMKDQSIIYYIA